MNERIKDVNPNVYSAWLQAAATVNPLKTGGDWQKDFVEKFAELIVRECIEICDNTTGNSYLNGWYAGKQIRKHFGVEE